MKRGGIRGGEGRGIVGFCNFCFAKIENFPSSNPFSPFAVRSNAQGGIGGDKKEEGRVFIFL